MAVTEGSGMDVFGAVRNVSAVKVVYGKVDCDMDCHGKSCY